MHGRYVGIIRALPICLVKQSAQHVFNCQLARDEFVPLPRDLTPFVLMRQIVVYHFRQPLEFGHYKMFPRTKRARADAFFAHYQRATCHAQQKAHCGHVMRCSQQDQHDPCSIHQFCPGYTKCTSNHRQFSAVSFQLPLQLMHEHATTFCQSTQKQYVNVARDGQVVPPVRVITERQEIGRNPATA